jgi:RNA polymerase sigma-70 factor (ECF subfamily)
MEIANLVTRARDGAAPEADRHRAFAELVRRFEDLAFGCAYSRLRDAALAEDAAQDAFLLAWERLDQLREPAAFAGWIRRLVLTQCHRRLRARRLEPAADGALASTESSVNVVDTAESNDDASVVRLALSQLAAGDRLVLTLFYGSGRTQAEIAGWLCVPVTTIARRIAHAKRRLRGHALRAFAGDLRRGRRVSGEAFLVEFTARLRRLDSRDADGVALLAGRLGLDRAPRVAPAAPPSAYVIEDPASRLPMAFASATQTIFRPIYDVQIAIGAAALRGHAGDVLLSQLLEDAIANDAIVLQHRTSARHADLVAFLLSRGFEIVERSQDCRRRGAAAAPADPPPGVTFAPLDVLTTDAALFDAAVALITEEALQDPIKRAFLPFPPEALRRGLRLQRDGVIALSADGLIGMLAASADDLIPDAARLNMLLVRRTERGRGIATAMLAHLMARHGQDSVRVVAPLGTDAAAWLSRRGFAQSDDTLLLERLLRKTVLVSPAVLNEYVGRYVAAVRPDAAIVIERFADTLVSKARDMRDVLLASSETEFFTRHHFGRGRFERDSDGRVARLVYTEGPHEMVARRM